MIVVNLVVDVSDEGVDDPDELLALRRLRWHLVIELVNAKANLITKLMTSSKGKKETFFMQTLMWAHLRPRKGKITVS